ncbi:MAG: oligopeptide transporter, OPT family [Thermoplasmata archaeon]
MVKFVPYIPPGKTIPELTVRAILLGVILAVVMAAANAYLGLYAGMTVAATIPAAVISMAILKGLFKTGTILENNIAQTIASSGEALAAGIIFTIPALLIMGVWHEIDYITVSVVAALGGLLGVLFTISLRKILIQEMKLPYPEGIACAEILKAGERGGKQITYVLSALVIGVVFKFISSGMKALSGKVEQAIGAGRAYFYFGSDLSPALLGVGYIVGPSIAFFVFLGGVIAWMLLVPLVVLANGLPLADNPVDALTIVWSDRVRYVGIGAMIVGGLSAIWSMRNAITKGVRGVIGGSKSKDKEKVIRTELDLPTAFTFILAGLISVCIFLMYWYVLQTFAVALVTSIIMVIAAFFFSAIAGYMAGIIGSSNNPISGVTIATLIFTALLLVALGVPSAVGASATILVAAIVCCAASIAGDNLQNLKTGYLLGSTPRNLQIALMIGVIVSAIIIPPVLGVLSAAYTFGSKALPAPQAGLMAMVTNGIFGGTMNWPYFLMGVELGILFIILRKPVMAIAVGMYLPFTLSIPILIGGGIKHFVDRKIETGFTTTTQKERMTRAETKELEKCNAEKDETYSRGVLFSSGLIAGEAITGVVVAALVAAGIIGVSEELCMIDSPKGILSIFVFLIIILILAYVVLRKPKGKR